MRFPFCGQSYSSQSPFVDHQRTLNWYQEAVESSTGVSSVVLYPTPGLETFVTLPTSPIRGTLFLNGRYFVVAGAKFYEVISNGTYYEYGTVANDGLPVTISSNGDAGHQLWIVSGGSGYIFDLLINSFTAALRTDSSFGGFLDGWFVNLDATIAKMSISDLENGLIWDPTQVAQRNTTPDRWVSMLIIGGRIWLFGRHETDIWGNAGTSPFPFAPIPGTLIDRGIAAVHSAAVLDNAPIWLGESAEGGAVVYRANGYTPVRVSNHAVEFAMQGYATVADAVAMTYQDQGHAFYCLSFPTAGATWVYDAATNLWHERGHWNASSGLFEVWAPRFHAFAFGKHLVGDGATGAIYDMAIDHFTDADGSPIRRMRQSPHLINEHGWMYYAQAELLCDVGTGTVGVPDPQIGLQWSDDSGHTWSTIRWISAGTAAAYKTRVIWRRIGRSRDRIYRVIADDGVPWRLIDLILQLEAGVS